MMLDIKKCWVCGVEKTRSYFYRSARNANGMSDRCKQCGKAAAKGWFEHNKSRDKENKRKWLDNNKERKAEIDREWAANHREEKQKSARLWAQTNPSKASESKAARHTNFKNAAPKWRNRFFIKEVYSFANLRSEVFGFRWHVDHIIPLKHKLVCGLHVENNLRVIPAIENMEKHNKWTP